MVGIQNVEDQFHDGNVTVGSVFGNKIFRNIVLSLAATYGLYIFASLLALDPWHMGQLLIGFGLGNKADDFQSPVSCSTSW